MSPLASIAGGAVIVAGLRAALRVVWYVPARSTTARRRTRREEWQRRCRKAERR